MSFFINNHLGGSAALVPGGADLCGDVGVNCGSFITAALLYYRYYPITDREEVGRGGAGLPCIVVRPSGHMTRPCEGRGGARFLSEKHFNSFACEVYSKMDVQC